MLSQAATIEFGEIQERTDLSKSALSKHLTQLTEAGYLAEKSFVRGGRSRLMMSLTRQGRGAYLAHREALAEILAADTGLERAKTAATSGDGSGGELPWPVTADSARPEE